ncbi:MAG: hypothetical protein IJ075_02835 [Lachnospiraceae bacterium]|nr:hypothetical protein [Lachnospiraceae bacterium]
MKLSGLTNLPVSLLNTHADPDHIASNEQFEEFYMHIEGYMDRFDEIWLSHADIPISKDVIQKLHNGAEDILAG